MLGSEVGHSTDMSWCDYIQRRLGIVGAPATCYNLSGTRHQCKQKACQHGDHGVDWSQGPIRLVVHRTVVATLADNLESTEAILRLDAFFPGCSRVRGKDAFFYLWLFGTARVDEAW